MTLPALALFYGGLVQAKNILSVLVQCAAVAALCSVLWFGIGYSLAYGGDGDWLGVHDVADDFDDVAAGKRLLAGRQFVEDDAHACLLYPPPSQRAP